MITSRDILIWFGILTQICAAEGLLHVPPKTFAGIVSDGAQLTYNASALHIHGSFQEQDWRDRLVLRALMPVCIHWMEFIHEGRIGES